MLRIIRVGICGTDREEASGGRAQAPRGQSELVIGHEMMAQVTGAGSDVTGVHPGDFAALTVRRPCASCTPWSLNRPDMCRTGEYQERGIWGMDGYQAEYVVDYEPYLVPIPHELEPVGVLVEPLSVAEKAIDEALHIQASRLPDFTSGRSWLSGKRCLVAGLGPIGLLAAMVLRLHGAEVYGLDVVDEGTTRPLWLAGIGGHYLDGRATQLNQLSSIAGSMDLIFEATGVPSLALNLLDALARDGVCVLTGIPGGDRPLQVPGAEIVRTLVLNNQVMVGSVNAAIDHYRMAVDDLQQAQTTWGTHVTKLISHRHPFPDFAPAFQHHGDDEIKAVIEWSTPQ